MIRKADIRDVPGIRKFLAGFQDDPLPRTLAYLYEHLRDYWIWELPVWRSYAIGGVASLHICWDGWAEIRSLAVDPDVQGQGIGSKLVERCLSEAETLRMKNVFVLCRGPEFFRRFGFHEIKKESLPVRIWADCVNCPKYPDCDEIPMRRVL
jgi:amino-acid N-acetyltransferase